MNLIHLSTNIRMEFSGWHFWICSYAWWCSQIWNCGRFWWFIF